MRALLDPRPAMRKTVKKLLRAVAHYDPDYYDMYADANESFFARVYLAHFLRHLNEAGIHPPAAILEAGCQTGRLAIPLAEEGFQVTGIDRSRFAIKLAKSHARRLAVCVEWLKADFLKWLKSPAKRLFDAAVCAEVAYTVPDYAILLKTIASAVRPGGLFFASHRQRFYYFVEALRRADAAKAREVASASEAVFGPEFPQSGYFNWQTPDELRRLYASLDLEWLGCYPIDRVAWLCETRFAELTPLQQEAWLRMELSQPEEAASCARYLLVVARRPQQA